MAFIGAVAEPHHPLRRMPQMIGAFLFRLRGNRRQRRVTRGHHRPPVEIGEGGIEELPHHGAGEIAVLLLDQQQVTILPHVTQIGESVFGVIPAFDLGGISVKLARLPEQVEAHIGERHVLFQHRRVAAPFRKAMAEDQRIIGAAQRIEHQRRFGNRD